MNREGCLLSETGRIGYREFGSTVPQSLDALGTFGRLLRFPIFVCVCECLVLRSHEYIVGGVTGWLHAFHSKFYNCALRSRMRCAEPRRHHQRRHPKRHHKRSLCRRPRQHAPSHRPWHRNCYQAH